MEGALLWLIVVNFSSTRAPDPQTQIVDPRYVAMMNAMMHETLVAGTARKAEIPGWSAAGKTGTSQDFRDAWFVGYTANLVTGVWLGNDDNSPTRKATGGGLPVEVWTRFMKVAHQNVPVAALPGSQPQGGFLSGLFGGNSRTSVQPARPQVSDANPSYIPPATNSPGWPVGVIGTMRPFTAMAWRWSLRRVAFTCRRSTDEST